MDREKTRLDSPSLYTIGWIAALAIDQAAARALLDEEHSEPNDFHPSPSDMNNYIWGRIGIWDARNGAFMHQIKTGSYVGKLKSVVFSEDVANLINVLSTGTVLIHDIQSGSCEQAFDLSSPSGDWSIELSHDFAMILTASSDDNTVRIWDPQTQTKSLKRARSREKSILEVEISPNGRTVVLHTVDGHEIWSLRRSKFECLLVGDSDFIEFLLDYFIVVVAS
ncbi:hypothetical protein FVEG_17661 [Fusarium verticillioides 7600]|uniref:Uncharacterized protein n=1 Tax=Gibberella moniliformis (strain M3125 / FGSC 7600) TaxID=334819 RepID=A0A139YBW3_GIBM7|nr:hypothetical protein FVEG_17661 [Fusarium verticillioides 7600]KYG13652.1 hypothetical protein FVEG_17661 [Fusarium verticillioides 7600]